MDKLTKVCPHCGALLPEAASFCPRCARSVRSRSPIAPPSYLWHKLLRPAIALALLLAVCLGLYLYFRPKAYDAYGEVTYTDADGTYQLLLSFQNDRFTPQPELTEQGEVDGEYRMPSRLFINHVNTGFNAGQMFMKKVTSVRTTFLQPEDTPSPMVCSQPEYRDFSPEAAMVSLVDYTGRSGTGELVWELQMDNGDTIRLRQKLTIEPIGTFDYYPQDWPMDTMEELQALVDQISGEVPMPDVVNLHLPAVTYEGSLTIGARPMNVYGSTEDGRRTTFTDTVQVAAQTGPINYFYDLDFVGDGSGIGLSSSARMWAENCSFTGWKTGVLGYGSVWVNVISCRFEDNEIGFHFNSEGIYVSHSMFNDNLFLHNDTAVLLERVPTDVTMNFQGSRFTGNGTDIDNRCNQPLHSSQAIFE